MYYENLDMKYSVDTDEIHVQWLDSRDIESEISCSKTLRMDRRTSSEESLEIPEEPKEDLVEDYEKENSKKEKEPRVLSALNFSTAVKIARWMARAYGYVAKKRQAYLVSFLFEELEFWREKFKFSKNRIFADLQSFIWHLWKWYRCKYIKTYVFVSSKIRP